MARQAVCGAATVDEKAFAQAEQRARALRLPLSWPDRSESGFPAALRAAAHAAMLGEGRRFALAAMRLAFCGGYDLDDPQILGEAAAAAGLHAEDCLAAADDKTWDEDLAATGKRVASAVKSLPAFRIGERWFEGEPGLLQAVASLRHLAEASAGVPA